ncbi:MAG: cobalt ECF transporter T component CbiQ [Planctomycetes bacterium]|nr:cobalt ECF transporter T component CbiQ [Planctomycetota bacterium]
MHHAHIDKFANQDSPIHRLDARVKLAVTLAGTLVIVALSRFSPDLAFYTCLGPFVVLVLGRIPLRFALKHVLLALPFILVLAMTSLWYDRSPATILFGPFQWHSTVGWLKCLTLTLKFAGSMLALVALISTTRFSDLLRVLQHWHVPEILVIQLGFLYRYIFVLIDKAHHTIQARAMRTLRRQTVAQEWRIGTAMIGSVLVQSLDTATQITQAMEARGFSGRWHSPKHFHTKWADWLFIALASLYLGVLLYLNHQVG